MLCEKEELAEHYNRLIRIILLDNNKKPYGNTFLCVYDTKDNEKLVAIFNNATQLAELLGTTINVVNSSISHKKLLFNRYLLKRVKID